MHPISLSRADQSRIHHLCNEALGAPTKGYPRNSDEAVRCGLSEVLAFHTNGSCHFSPAQIFEFAERALSHRDLHCEQDAAAAFDIPSLAHAIGDREIAVLVAKLCGQFCADGVWRDRIGSATTVVFSPELFEQ